MKHLTGQVHPKTSLVYEYPRAEGDPYYPIPQPANGVLYKRYQALAEATPGVHFVGRLATYKYYNMDQVVAQAQAVFERIEGKHLTARFPEVVPNAPDAAHQLDAGDTPPSGNVGRNGVHS